MPIVDTISSFAFRIVTGDRVDVLFRLAMDHTSDHSQKILRILEECNRKAWRSLEIALAGETIWTRLDRAESKSLRAQVRAFLDAMPLPTTGDDPVRFRQRCLTELRDALTKGLLLGSLVAADLAEKAGQFARFNDPQALLAAEKDALRRLGQDVQAAGFKALGWLLAQPAQADQSVVVVAAGYFFRRQVEKNPELFRGLQLKAMEELSQAQEAGFVGVVESLAATEGRLEESLEQVAAALGVKLDTIHTDVVEAREDVQQVRQDVQGVWDSVEGVHDSVKEVKDSVSRVQQNVQQIQGAVADAVSAAVAAKGAAEAHAADSSRRLDELQVRMAQLLEKLDMKNQPVAPTHSLSIRSDQERERVRELLGQLRSLPDSARESRPGLVTDIGKLQIAVGDFTAAGVSFEAAAALATTDPERAEAHHNAYRAKLEQEDFSGALAELLKAVEFDPHRFAPFPLDKYVPEGILGAGGFGVTFKCRHALTRAWVAVKAIDDGDLDRDAGAVLKEAMALDGLKHRAIIGLRDCGYADSVRSRRPYLVMEYFDGPTLKEHVEKTGSIPLADLVPLAKTLAEALKAAHDQGVLHRDIKPANVMVRRLPDPPPPAGTKRKEPPPAEWEVRLIDFGLALKSEVLRGSLSTRRGATIQGTSIAGTLDYAAPEQMGQLPGAKVGPPADVYGFAKTMCFALFRTPRPGMQHYEALPRSVAKLIDKSLRDNPDERPQNFDVVLEVIGRQTATDAADDGRTPGRRPPPVPDSALGKMKEGLKELMGMSPPPPPKESKSGPQPRPPAAPQPAIPAPPKPPAPTKPKPPVDDDIPTLTLDEERPKARPAPRSPAPRSERRPPQRPPSPGGGDRTTHGVIALLLGGFGLHKFLQGNTGNGILRVVLGLLTCWIVTGIISLIEGIQYLSMSDAQYDRDYIRNKKDWF